MLYTCIVVHYCLSVTKNITFKKYNMRIQCTCIYCTVYVEKRTHYDVTLPSPNLTGHCLSKI